MTMPSALIRLQTPDDYAALIEMNERAFGPGRFARTAYRVREGAMHDPRLNLCAVLEGEIIGSVDFTPDQPLAAFRERCCSGRSSSRRITKIRAMAFGSCWTALGVRVSLTTGL